MCIGECPTVVKTSPTVTVAMGERVEALTEWVSRRRNHAGHVVMVHALLVCYKSAERVASAATLTIGPAPSAASGVGRPRMPAVLFARRD
jgi:hypothetical protein